MKDLPKRGLARYGGHECEDSVNVRQEVMDRRECPLVSPTIDVGGELDAFTGMFFTGCLELIFCCAGQTEFVVVAAATWCGKRED